MEELHSYPSRINQLSDNTVQLVHHIYVRVLATVYAQVVDDVISQA